MGLTESLSSETESNGQMVYTIHYYILLNPASADVSYIYITFCAALSKVDRQQIIQSFTKFSTLNLYKWILRNRVFLWIHHNVHCIIVCNGFFLIKSGIFNARLDDHYAYTFFQRTFMNGPRPQVSNLWTPTTLAVKTPTEATADNDEIVIISISILIGVITLIVLMVFCCHWKYSRNYRPKPVKKKRTDPVQRQSTGIEISVRPPFLSDLRRIDIFKR